MILFVKVLKTKFFGHRHDSEQCAHNTPSAQKAQIEIILKRQQKEMEQVLNDDNVNTMKVDVVVAAGDDDDTCKNQRHIDQSDMPGEYDTAAEPSTSLHPEVFHTET
jgi:hypothetical protein